MEERELDRKLKGWLVAIACGVAALVVAVTFLILDSNGRGREEARAAGDREGALRARVETIDDAAERRHQEILRGLATLEREVRLLSLRVDALDHGGEDAANRSATAPKEP